MAKKKKSKPVLPADYLRNLVKPFWDKGQTVLDMLEGTRKIRDKYDIKKSDIKLAWNELTSEKKKAEKAIRDNEKKKQDEQKREAKRLEQEKKKAERETAKERAIQEQHTMQTIPNNVITDRVYQANLFLQKNPFFYARDKSWWKYENFKWSRCDETDLLIGVYGAYRADVLDSKEGAEIKTAFKISGRNVMPPEAPDTWVQFRGTIHDLTDDIVIKANHKFFITNPIPWSLGESEDTPTIDKLFIQWVGKEHKKELYEVLAECFIRKYHIHRIFCFTGVGSNGKGTFIRLLKKLLGEDNIVGASLDRLNKSRFESATLYKKLACLITETSNVTLQDTSMLKALTGEDFVGAEFKGKDPFSFTNYAKIIIATNTLPESKDKTDGFYRRWHIIDFPNQFAESDILTTIPEKEYNNLALKCLNIAKSLWKNPVLTNDGTISKRRESYEEHSDPIEKFIKEKCVKDFEGKIGTTKLYNNFLVFIRKKGYNKINYHEFIAGVEGKGFTRDKVRLNPKIPDSNPVSAIIGLREKSDLLDFVPDVPDVPGGSTQNPIGDQVDTLGTSGTSGTNTLKTECIASSSPLSNSNYPLSCGELSPSNPSPIESSPSGVDSPTPTCKMCKIPLDAVFREFYGELYCLSCAKEIEEK